MTEREVARLLCTLGFLNRPSRPGETIALRLHPLFEDELLVSLFDAATGAEVQRFRCEITEVDTLDEEADP